MIDDNHFNKDVKLKIDLIRFEKEMKEKDNNSLL